MDERQVLDAGWMGDRLHHRASSVSNGTIKIQMSTRVRRVNVYWTCDLILSISLGRSLVFQE